MPFDSGRVTFCRFAVHGDAPSMADDTTLATLAENAFEAQDIGAPAEIESGWITGRHIYDTQFAYDKNAFGGAASDLLLFALRVDTNKIPAEVKQAHLRIQEQAMAEQKDNPTGFLSRREKRDAKEQTQRELHDELASGKFRRSKSVPILWDLRRHEVYCGASGNTILEQLYAKFRDSFNVDLEPLTSGAMAGRYLRDHGKGRDYEDVRPSPFTAAPPGAEVAGDEVGAPRDPATPFVPWVYTSTDTKDFLGNEFVIWLWWMCESSEGLLSSNNGIGKFDLAVLMDKALDMDCAWGVSGKQTLRGDGPTKLPEAGDALAGGKWPRKTGMILADNEEGLQWEFSLQADRMIVGAAALPQIEDASHPRDVIEGRLQFIRRLAGNLDGMFNLFLTHRISGEWPGMRGTIRQWIVERG